MATITILKHFGGDKIQPETICNHPITSHCVELTTTGEALYFVRFGQTQLQLNKSEVDNLSFILNDMKNSLNEMLTDDDEYRICPECGDTVDRDILSLNFGMCKSCYSKHRNFHGA